MIVKDEEAVLSRALDSIKDVVDEMIIVDTGSKDQTKAIASRYTPHVYDFIWCSDFAKARNYAFSKGTMDYLMWLDADDVLKEADRQELLALKETLNDDVDMVMMPYVAAVHEDGSIAFSYERERLFRRDRHDQWQGAVHEVIVPAGKVLHSRVHIWHQSIKKTKTRRNLDIYEAIRKTRSLDAREQFYYARELQECGESRAAVQAFITFLQRGDGWAENCIDACRHLAYLEPEEALNWLFHSFIYGEPHAEVLCEIGSCLFQMRRYQEAIYWYRQALYAKRVKGAFIVEDAYGFLPSLGLCVCYDQLHQQKRAYHWHLRSKHYHPEHPSVLHNEAYFQQILGSLHAKQGKTMIK